MAKTDPQQRIQYKERELMITLTDSEIKDLLAHYAEFKIEESVTVESNWVSRKFPSTGRVARCVESDKSVIIKQVIDPRKLPFE